MFLEIGALLFLMFAAMSPILKKSMDYRVKSALIIIDTSGSMQFKNTPEETRFEKAIKDAVDYVEMSDADISVMRSDVTSELIINSSHDKSRIISSLKKLKCTDAAGDITKAKGLFESLDVERIIVFTDGAGAESLKEIAAEYPMDIYVCGGESDNVALSQMSIKKNAEGLFDAAFTYNITGGHKATFDVSLFDSDGNLIEVRTVENAEDKNGSLLMLNKDIKSEYVRGEISSVSFSGDGYSSDMDGLDRDNTAYAVTSMQEEFDAYLLGTGNIYIEKAFHAYTGDNIIKTAGDTLPAAEGKKKVVGIYDMPLSALPENSGIIFNYSEGGDTQEGALVNVKAGELLTNTVDFSFGANDLSILTLPEWGNPLMTITREDGSEGVVGYFGEDKGIKRVVLGFDIRNSEFPLMAEFPIFIADSIGYLTDERAVKETYIQAGEGISISSSVSKEDEIKSLNDDKDTSLTRAGLYKLADTFFVVRYPVSESDGSVGSDSITSGVASEYSVRYSSLRNLCLWLALIMILMNTGIYIYRNKGIRGLALAARILLVALVILAILDVNLPGKRKGTATIFLVDMSDSSILTHEAKQDYLRSVISSMPSSDAFGVVTFGGNVITDQFVNTEAQYLDIASKPKSSSTNIEGAVRYAASMIPDDRFGRVVLLTDGKETAGDVTAVKDQLQENDIELCLKLYESERSNDVYVQSAEMPEKLVTGDRYNLKITVYSSFETNGTLKVFNGSEEISSSQVKLNPGENTFIIEDQAGDKNIEERTVTIEAEGDTLEENNSMVAAAMVDAPKKILLVSGLSEDSTGFQKLLSSTNIDLTTVSAINAPDTIVRMLQYKLIIIDNCYISDLPEGFVNSIEAFVKDYGGGVIVTGGKESYAPGGYTDTPLERILPVEMLPKGLDEAPALAMVMVIDCSGSMMDSGVYSDTGESVGRSKIDVAVDAAKEAVDSMTRRDQVGVLTFSDEYQWRQKITYAEDKDSIKDEIEKIGIEGGTVIKPGLKEAAEKLAGADAGVKHILLLTDGEGETKAFDDVLKIINENNITLSTVAVGSDSDCTLLENLADKGGGRYYYSDSSSDVPKIFAEEVYLSGDTYFKNGEYDLSVNSSNKFVEGLYSEGMPQIQGYVATTTKSGAREVITTSEDDPLLSSWQYGLGTTIAWTTNASGTWNEALSAHEDYAAMWKRMVDAACMDNAPDEDSVSLIKRRGRIDVDYQSANYSEDTQIKGVYTSPSGESGELILSSEEPGRYTGSFTPDEPGVYSINIRRNEKDVAAAVTTAIQTVQFSDEYRQDISNQNLISFVEANGRILSDGDKVFTKLKGKKNNKKNITFIIIIISVIMLIFDIIVRRFDLGRRLLDIINDKKRKRRMEKASSLDYNRKAADEKAVQIPDAKTFQDISDENSGLNNQDMYVTSQQADSKKDSKKNKKKEKRKKSEPVPQTLDTASLLKKKQDRNL